jgi:hypothetical protein
MTAQIDLFAWASPPAAPPPVWHGAARYGWTIAHPCACGQTHTLTYLDYPWSMWSLRHWRLARRERAQAMADQWGGYAREQERVG